MWRVCPNIYITLIKKTLRNSNSLFEFYIYDYFNRDIVKQIHQVERSNGINSKAHTE